MERMALWLTIAALILAIFILATHQAQMEDELSHPRVETTSTTTTTASPLPADLVAIQQQVNELRANRGLTGPEVRELVETLLPVPQNPPTDEPCAEPPCGVTPTSSTATSVTPRSTTPTTTAPEKRRRRR